ncbi:MAG: hypothetical protein OXI87_21380 [Albidovulum sp.]|nr:hypothetical protein [Albidovulum sp.]
MNEQASWRHSETRAISPFMVSKSCLRNLKFRIYSDAEFLANDPWNAIVEPELIHSEEFRPELLLDVDLDALGKEADVDPAEFRLSIVLRDSAIWSSRAVSSWRLKDLPLSHCFLPDQLSGLAGQRGLQFSVLVTPDKNLEERFRRAWRKGQIVARRDFILSPPIDGVGFPIQVVPAETFVTRGLPADSVWYIDWIDWFDFDKPPEDVLCIYLNEEVAKKLLLLAGNDAVGNVLWTSIATDALLEITLRIFLSDPMPPEDPKSLLARVIGTMQSVSGQDLNTLVAQAKSADGWSFFRTHVQCAFEFGKKSKALNVGGRKR